MPTIASSNIPAPKSWDEFEDITLSSAKLRWDSSDFFRHGRQGQKQNGVDIWGHDDDGRHIGVQCKNTVNRISIAVIEAEVKSAELFTSDLDHLYIATTAKRDALVQREVRRISEQRKKESKFKVNILFWDDICHDLSKDEEVFFQHYPQFRPRRSDDKSHDKRLYQELISLLKSDGVIAFLDRTNMAGFPFPEEDLEPIREFYYKWNVPEREFIDPDLENIRKDLWKAVDEYYEIIATETFPTRNPRFHSVPPELEFDDPKRFHKIVSAIHAYAEKIVTLHGKFVRKGRVHLFGG